MSHVPELRVIPIQFLLLKDHSWQLQQWSKHNLHPECRHLQLRLFLRTTICASHLQFLDMKCCHWSALQPIDMLSNYYVISPSNFDVIFPYTIAYLKSGQETGINNRLESGAHTISGIESDFLIWINFEFWTAFFTGFNKSFWNKNSATERRFRLELLVKLMFCILVGSSSECWKIVGPSKIQIIIVSYAMMTEIKTATRSQMSEVGFISSRKNPKWIFRSDIFVRNVM